MNGHSFKLAILIGALGLVLTTFLIVVYYVHLCTLPDVSIEAIRYEASTLSAAMAFLVLSLNTGLIALVIHGERKCSWLMLVSTVTAIIAYVFPCKRLWKLGYTSALSGTISLATIHIALLISSFLLLKVQHKSS